MKWLAHELSLHIEDGFVAVIETAVGVRDRSKANVRVVRVGCLPQSKHSPICLHTFFGNVHRTHQRYLNPLVKQPELTRLSTTFG